MSNYANTLVILFLVISNWTYSQVQREDYDKVYGLDPTLYNGKLYTFYAPAGSSGNQFLDNSVYTNGSVIIKGIRYDSLMLNYDLVNQQILMKFKHLNGTTGILCISTGPLENVHFGNRDFEFIKPINKEEGFFQTIGKGNVRILISWWKVLSASNSYGESNMVFSKAHRAMYVYRDNQLFKFKNNRSFISGFKKEQQLLIKQFLRQNNIRVSKLSDTELLGVIDFCNTI